jgi:hypothetical protein
MIREKPFSTGLFFAINKKMNPLIEQLRENRKKQTQSNNEQHAKTTSKTVPKNDGIRVPTDGKRAMYYTHPRWVIDDSMIRSISTSTNEAQRCNFVQMWGTSLNNDFVKPQTEGSQNPIAEFHQELQLLAGNFASDDLDISRHGMRAVIETTNFDEQIPQTPLWVRIKADWLFNGHLKLNANVVCNGIQEPICEGDNCEIRGVVYHIESVSHSASISPNGQKEWVTTLTLSNGILSESLTSEKDIPQYSTHRGASQKHLRETENVPGVTYDQFLVNNNNDENKQ